MVLIFHIFRRMIFLRYVEQVHELFSSCHNYDIDTYFVKMDKNKDEYRQNEMQKHRAFYRLSGQ